MTLLIVIIIFIIIIFVFLYVSHNSTSNKEGMINIDNTYNQDDAWNDRAPDFIPGKGEIQGEVPADGADTDYLSSAYDDLPPEQVEKNRVRNHIDANLFTDRTFWDVLVYDNDPYTGRSGLDRCLDNQVGVCVPWGNVTGIAYYYPPMYTGENYGDMENDELTPQERRQPNVGSLTYPNLR